MRAKDFITETQRGKPLDAQEKVSPGAVYTVDGYYDLYRASMLMARTPSDTGDIDSYSWATKLPVLVTYTDEERDMVKQAFSAMGIPFKEHIAQGSEEPDNINTQSPTFSGKVFGK